MDIKVLVATHKKYQMPKEDIYFPMHVGKEGKQDLGYQGDNTEEHISDKNSNYCELTGLYWAWKNLNCEYIGLCHYRRYFTIKPLSQRLLNKNNKFDLILTQSEIEDMLSRYDIIVPTKRNYFIETIRSHYQHAHHIKDLDETKKIISEKYPEYLGSFEQIMNGTTLHLFNMFIMKKADFNRYCEWLFDILFELEQRVDISDYDAYQSRIFGFISERLFNVWLLHQNFNKKAIPAINMEDIDWANKIKDFISRKLSNGRK